MATAAAGGGADSSVADQLRALGVKGVFVQMGQLGHPATRNAIGGSLSDSNVTLIKLHGPLDWTQREHHRGHATPAS